MQKRQLEHMEVQIKDLRASLRSLAEPKEFDQLGALIRKKGFTTPAEAALLIVVLDSMQAATKNLVRMKQALLSGAEKVELNPQPLPP